MNARYVYGNEWTGKFRHVHAWKTWSDLTWATEDTDWDSNLILHVIDQKTHRFNSTREETCSFMSVLAHLSLIVVSIKVPTKYSLFDSSSTWSGGTTARNFRRWTARNLLCCCTRIRGWLSVLRGTHCMAPASSPRDHDGRASHLLSPEKHHAIS